MKNRKNSLYGSLFIVSVFLVSLSACSKDNGGSSLKVEDADGNIYHTVKIGHQVWLRENLNTTHFENGDPIPTTSPRNLDISSESDAVYQWVVAGLESNAAIYGRLYTWNAAMDDRGICPEGWHIPTDAEWLTLIEYLGSGYDIAGNEMKEVGTAHWYYSYPDVTNSSRFTALPGDYRAQSGNMGTPGFQGVWWSSTLSDVSSAYTYTLDYSDGAVIRSGVYLNHGLSVRCIMDEE